MKKAKKLTAFLLLAAFVFAFIVPVTAMAEQEESGSITIDNPQENQIYTAYKIFDVVYNTDKTAYSYTIETNSEWFDVVAEENSDGTVVSLITGLTITKAAGSDTTYVVTVDDDFSAASFANTLKQALQREPNISTGTKLTNNGTAIKADNLSLGYYFVSSASGALCNLTTTDPDVTIHDKNDVPFEKTVDQHSADIGGTVGFTIEGKVPDTTGFTEYQYIIEDTMSDGLTFTGDDLEVLVNGQTLGQEYYTLTFTKKNEDENSPINGFELTIDVMELTEQVGKEIEVTYSATVNEGAIANVESNSATLTYSNDPTDAEKTNKTQPDTEKVYSSKIVIDKYDSASADKSTKLSGAQFVLINDEGKYYHIDANGETDTLATVNWVDSQESATVATTDTQGSASFDGLKDGSYSLKEIKAPEGYNLLTNIVSVTINGSDVLTNGNDVRVLTVEAEVGNNTGSTLPETGGIGTTIFYAVGGVLVVGAGVLLITRKRMSVEK